MTRKEILVMEPGPELDALVAEKVMELKPCIFHEFGSISGLATFWQCEHGDSSHCYPINEEALKHPHSPLARYSVEIAAAFQVEEEIARRLIMPGYIRQLRNLVMTHWQIEQNFRFEDAVNLLHIWRFTHATPEQRCKAALLAVMGDEVE